MNETTVSVIPDGESAEFFERATISIVQIGPEWIPDLDPDVLDRGLDRLQTAMHGKVQRTVDDLREWLDWPPARSRRELGMRLRTGEPSDVSLAAAMLSAESPFGLQFHWEPGALSCWSDGMTWVLYRGHTYERLGDTLVLLNDAD